MESKKENKKRAFLTTSQYLSLISSVFVVLLTVTIFLLSKGYRINFSKRAISKTGAIIVRSQPSGATVLLNGENIGKTTKSRVVESGEYDVSVKKDKYREWKKHVSVAEERPTQLLPWLISEDLRKYTVWESKQLVEKSWINEKKDVALVLLKENGGIYSLWRYKIERGMFDISSNPVKVWETENPNIEISLAPDGVLALLTINKDTELQAVHVVDSTNIAVTTNNLLNLTNINDPKISWSKDSKNLIIESPTEIFSYNYSEKILYSLMKKPEGDPLIWTTSNKGDFYFIENSSTSDSPAYLYTLKTISLKDTTQQTVLKDIYMQKDLKYINYYRENLPTPVFFTNSPINTQTVGKINNISIDSNIGILLISTETSAYLYNTKSSMYMMISPFPTKFGEISPDGKSLLYYSNNEINVFSFEKEELDHTKEIGAKKFTQEGEVENIEWISNSRYFSYTKNGNIYISQTDGENEYEILPLDNTPFFTVKYSLDSIILFGQDTEGNFTIDEYRLTN